MIPPNIAPLDFRIQEPGLSFAVRIAGEAGTPIEISSRKPEVVIPINPGGLCWKATAVKRSHSGHGQG